MGVLLVKGEPEGSAEAGPQPEPADDDTTPAVAGSGEPGTG
jgi:hypothetical protein